MQALLNAIATKFSTTSSITSAITGGLHLDEAKDSTAMPYMTYTVMAAPTNWGFGIKTAAVTIRFDLYYTAADTALTKLAAFTAVFDDFLPTLSSGTVFDSMRDSGPTLMLVPFDDRNVERDSNVARVYRASVEYRYSVLS